ncbi:SLC13 family permease [Thalassotalea aquiviva]|uniref:SLC13 family permease n=1 Tax=Thalassotalea aquiviva TaxID=3242415 RepID=UPI00352AED75
MTPEIITLLIILSILAVLILSAKIELDIVAIILLITIVIIQHVSGLDLLPQGQIFSGFSSPLVIAIIGITIVSGAMEKTGYLNPLIQVICQRSKNDESRIIIYVCLLSGLTSAFIQNIAAVALMIPIVNQICKQTDTPISYVMMPMAFCAVLGGSLTMIGASPTIFLQNYYQINYQNNPLTITSITPIGLVLLIVGIAFFVKFGRKLLPTRTYIANNYRNMSYFQKAYGLKAQFFFTIKNVDALEHATIGCLEDTFGLSVVGHMSKDPITSPPRHISLKNGDIIAAISTSNKTDDILINDFAILTNNHYRLKMALDPERMGIAEILVRPTSSMNGQTVRDLRFRATFGLNALAIIKAGGNMIEDVRNSKLQPGDTLVCHGKWADFKAIQQGGDFAVLDQIPDNNTVEYGRKRLRSVCIVALFCLFFTKIPLAITLLGTAFAIMALGLVSSREAYNMVSWKNVFFLAGMIPFGHALEHSGAVAFLASYLQSSLLGSDILVTQIVLAIVSVIAGSMLSNVGAAIVLIPIAVSMSAGNDSLALMYSLIVAVSVSNSFYISSHQVNMLIAYPGKYATSDFLKVGSLFTFLSIFLTLVAVNLFY